MDVAPPSGRLSASATHPEQDADAHPVANTRNSTIDLFRVIAIFGVILVHTSPVLPKVFPGTANQIVNLMITGAGRLSVPFFFVVSGYFFGRKIHDGAPPLPLFVHYAKRLLRIWVLWSLIFLVLPLRVEQWSRHGWAHAVVHQFEHMAADPLLIVWVGGKGDMWFRRSLPVRRAGADAARILPQLRMGIHVPRDRVFPRARAHHASDERTPPSPAGALTHTVNACCWGSHEARSPQPTHFVGRRVGWGEPGLHPGEPEQGHK